MGLTGVVVLALLGYYNPFKRVRASAIPRDPSQRPCTTFTIPVSLAAQNHLYDLVPVNNNIDAVHWEQDLDTWDNPSIPERVTGNVTVSRSFDVHAQLCVPPSGGKKTYLQIASHGGGFDSRYWDARIEPEQYSYVDAALGAGYSILTYDRIGYGQSSRADAYTEVQVPAEVEVLRVLSEMARNGTIASLALNSHSPWASSAAFDKIIHVGHSLGSIISYNLIAVYPNVSDAAILTGFIIDKEVFSSRQTSMGYEYAAENDPQLFGEFGPGYLVNANPSNVQSGFFSSRVNTTTGIGGFEPEVLDYAYSIRQPTAETEMGSGVVMTLQHEIAPEYTGPVQLVLGEFDFIVCLGDCRNTYNATVVNEMFPKAKNVDVYLQLGTGHALPLHKGAPLGFQASFEWLSSNGF